MTYQQTLDYLYTQLPMFSRIGSAAYKKDLRNTILLCDYIGNPQTKFKSIHIAGTNGKGSTSHMLAAILQSAGYKTGLYTSPHIKDFRERIRVNGEMIREDAVVAFVARTKEKSEEINPSFFELTVAMAFDYFAAEACDIVVVETGLGGLLDSTNIISPILSIITNIGYDHQNILGNTLEEIATQKAGIIKESTPVVIGETLPETKNIFIEMANEKHAEIFFANEMFIADAIKLDGNVLHCQIQHIITCSYFDIQLGLTGLYQTKNICTVLEAVEQLKNLGLSISDEALHTGLLQVKQLTGLRGRWDIIQETPLVIADVAHNKDGIAQVLQQLNTSYINTNFHFVLGFVKDKDVEEVLKLFPSDASYYFTNAHIPRALACTALAEKANAVGLLGNCFDDVNDAIDAAKNKANPHDVIMVCGSFFILAEMKGI